jgi:hypothetical protein
MRRWIYAGFDALFAMLYLVVTLVVVPSRTLSGTLMATALIAGASAACAGMLWGRRRGYWFAVVGCVFLLLAECLLLVLILWSAAFLSGVYGAFGQGAAALALVVALLSIQLVALLPAFQLKFLMTRRGRAVFGVARGAR